MISVWEIEIAFRLRGKTKWESLQPDKLEQVQSQASELSSSPRLEGIEGFCVSKEIFFPKELD